jgi:hypothetical protein
MQKPKTLHKDGGVATVLQEWWGLVRGHTSSDATAMEAPSHYYKLWEFITVRGYYVKRFCWCYVTELHKWAHTILIFQHDDHTYTGNPPSPYYKTCDK